MLFSAMRGAYEEHGLFGLIIVPLLLVLGFTILFYFAIHHDPATSNALPCVARRERDYLSQRIDALERKHERMEREAGEE